MVGKEKIFGLDLMRCLAICFVLFAHTFFLLPYSAQTEDMALRCFGFIGVEIFFVLSGYLVGKILINLFRNNPVNLRTTFYFWIRRWFRTLPNYYLALLLSAGVFYFTNKEFIFSDTAHLLYFVFSQNLFDPHPGFFSLAWSLSIEEWFYILMPLWFILWHKIVRGRKLFIILGIISFMLLILVFRVINHFNNDSEWDSGIRRVVVFRMDAIMTGVLAAMLHLDGPQIWKKFKTICLIAGLSLLMVLSRFFYRDVAGLAGSTFFMNTFFFNVVSLAIGLTLPFLSEWNVRSFNFFHRAVAHISRISYSLYLIHVIVVFVVLTLLNKISADLNVLKFIASWVFCILAASILYSKFELPMMNKRDKYKLK
jgi:peptidoglycan/LPS O-acetylase OafA/YrhL